ncbi:AraC family ligand binding domain-containing protein, partial [Pseudoalteromonas sp. S554]|uniref:AraC family ligand binding domain-containing protein n=1 Tax=Pseudoalteromonas sp. S554 TaxID=2066516 RepID=UPI0020176AC4
MNNGKPLFYHSIGLPIEARSADNSEACYKKHTHEEFSVGIVEKGVSEYFNTRKKEEIGNGSTVIINPSDVHSCNPKNGYTWNYKMLFVDPQWLHCESPRVCQRLNNLRNWNYEKIKSLYIRN